MSADFSRRDMLGAAAVLGASAAATSADAVDVSNRSGAPNVLKTLVERERRTIKDAMIRDGVEGVAVCLIHDGRPAWVEGFGVTDRPGGRGVGPDTLFSIQSTSKNVTAVAILIAVQQGLLDLDAPIATYLPDFSVHDRFAPNPQARITLRRLLSHRAGFTHEAPIGNNYDPSSPSFEAHVHSISETWLRYPVGERYRYSNLGYDLAGFILQTKTGIPFAEWVRRALFEPLGMTDSTFDTETYVASRNRAVGHQEGYAAVPLRTPLIPSGGLYTSAKDFAAYSQFHLRRGRSGDRQVLSEALWREMHGFALGGDYGLGVIRLERRYGDTPVRLLSHKGGGFGFGSVYVYCPEAGMAWAALFNRPADSCYRLGEALVDGLLRERWGERRPRLAAGDLASIQPLASQKQRLLGRYVGRNSVATITEQAGDLVKEENGETATIGFVSPDELFVVDAQGETVAYRLALGTLDLPDHLECTTGEQSLDRNDGAPTLSVTRCRECSAVLGDYHVDQWGRSSLKVTLSERRGELYLDDTRLAVEIEPLLFATTDGEIVDLRERLPVWKSLKLIRDA